MTSLRHFTLGESFPPGPHAVVSSLPTMTDVRDYKEHNPRVLDLLESGYPRFVEHIFVRELVKFYCQREELSGRTAVLIPGRSATQDLVDHIGLGVTATKVDEALFLAHCDANDKDLSACLRKFIQRTGCGISSRQAEDGLLTQGLLDGVFPEKNLLGASLELVETELAKLTGSMQDDVLVCSSGMNAFYSAFRAVQELQSARGRKFWLQLGWLYLDSGSILKEFLNEGACLDFCYDVTNTDLLVERIEACGDSLACVVVECPTNPLVQVADLPRISAVVRANGGILMVDPTIASIYNIDALPHADILTTSLTKYAAHEGDLMIGALALNSSSPYYSDLILRVSAFHQAPYFRDLARLAYQMKSAAEQVGMMNSNARRIADYLCNHSVIKEVHYTAFSPHFTDVAKSEYSGGAVVTFELKGGIDSFYEALRLMKGPSFGTVFSLASPFIYLAHYDLVSCKSGRDFLLSIGINPELIRLSVGNEPFGAIESTLALALESAYN